MPDLDMYLTRKFYVKAWPHTDKEDKYEIKITKGGGKSPIQEDKIAFIDTEEIYWKDALAIHLWFVRNVQRGIEDNEEHLVSEAKLQELQKIISMVLSDKTKADKLLPIPSKKYDSEYFDILTETKEKLAQALASHDGESDFYYSASE